MNEYVKQHMKKLNEKKVELQESIKLLIENFEHENNCMISVQYIPGDVTTKPPTRPDFKLLMFVDVKSINEDSQTNQQH